MTRVADRLAWLLVGTAIAYFMVRALLSLL